jgi:hypothetical protein
LREKNIFANPVHVKKTKKMLQNYLLEKSENRKNEKKTETKKPVAKPVCGKKIQKQRRWGKNQIRSRLQTWE